MNDVVEGAKKSDLTAQEVEECMKMMQDQRIKDKLKAVTEEAFKRGVSFLLIFFIV